MYVTYAVGSTMKRLDTLMEELSLVLSGRMFLKISFARFAQ